MDYAVRIIKLSKEFARIRDWPSLLSNPFRNNQTLLAVNNIDLEVKRGRAFCILGPNGAGKTTLIKILCTLILPTSGTAFINGYEITKDDQKIRASIGLVTGEERSLYWRLTGRQNLYFFATLYNVFRPLVKQRVEELLQLLSIAEPDKRVGLYSAGMKQRLAIARSLLHNPPIIIMDEPTKSLDPRVSQELRIFIRDEFVHKQGKTMLFTTHNLTEAEFLADDLAIIEQGKIKAQGSWDELKGNYVYP
ncbi:MAG: ABC transporter ATP-binding protein [Candidatus Omnitrophica bacterium]|nr:ABC transporter ATP-binding protein [Candidatus Omnitrophota bacterium]MBU1922957.1 ABC transporter ATP-binding protein [Candidatus Omnitrophota bacterium]